MDTSGLTATAAVGLLRSGEVSSVELLSAHVDVVEEHNPAVNAVVAQNIEAAMELAANADATRAAGGDLGPLAGLPMTVKDTYETIGITTTSGSSTLAEHVPEVDADAVQAIKGAGGIVYGKTNVPLFAGDHQTYNEVYGLTRNPWDLERSAGGSSGGAAAAVALGMSLAEVGSDIGGSVRQPAHFNGVFALKTTYGVVSMRGHIPGPPGTLSAGDLSVVGPLGRSVDDLELVLRTVLEVGAFGGIPGAALPASGGRPAPEVLRLGLWSDDEMAPVASVCRSAAEEVAAAMSDAGAAVNLDFGASMPSRELHVAYLGLLWPQMGAGLPRSLWSRLEGEARSAAEDSLAAVPARLMTESHREWLKFNERRAHAQAGWASTFENLDAVIMPVAPTQAFPHNIEASYAQRTVDVDGVDRPYMDTLFWAGLATMPGLPSVAIPTGVVNGLPVGVQIVGPRYSDFGLLDIARTICEVTGAGFVPPPSPG
jgi:amidase